MIKKLPLPISGLMLSMAAVGNLLLSYGSIYRSIFGIMASFVLILLLAKVLVMPKALKEGFENPVIASVIPTFSMSLMLLSTYAKPYAPSAAFYLWLFGVVLHCILIVLFSWKYMRNFNIKKVFPSYFIVYVGIVSASVTAPAFNMSQLGQYIFWFGLMAYIVLLPVILYRTFIIKEVPEPALPTLAIYTAPTSLCLAGYLNSFPNKNMAMVAVLAVLSVIMFAAVIAAMPKLLRLSFYPSYSAFTFPFVITAIAMKGANAYLFKAGISIPFLGYFVNFLELWAVTMVLYVAIRYTMFMLANPTAVQPAQQAKA